MEYINYIKQEQLKTILFIFGNSNICPPFFNSREQSWKSIRVSIYYNTSYYIYRTSGYWIFCIWLYNIWWYLRYLFLFWNRISRSTCYNRYNIFSSRIMTCSSISFYWKPSFRFWIWDIILTFCGCSLIIFIYIYILLRILIRE